MILCDFLLHHTKVHDLCIFRRSRYHVGCTIIDHEDLFLESLDSTMLNQEVLSHKRTTEDWTTKPIIYIDIT